MIERPDLSHMNTQELAQMLIICGASDDESDRQFAKFCADELKRRGPSKYTPPSDYCRKSESRSDIEDSQ